MHSVFAREASQASSFLGCCTSTNLLDFNSLKSAGAMTSQYEFVVASASSLYPHTRFTNHESLPSLQESFSNFRTAFPQYSQTDEADRIRAQEYYHLSFSKHVCLDYIGHGLFSYSQLQIHNNSAPIASSSTSPPSLHSTTLGSPFFDISYKSVNLNAQLKNGGQETELESKIHRRIMAFMNISKDDYTMVFTANHSSAFKLLADFYPFESNRNLLTVYDYENDAVETMIKSSKKRGARVMSAEFSWPNLGIQSEKLRRKLESKTKRWKKGLFVFPLQSRMTGARYSYQWLSMAQENGWHVLLDASALGPKDMDTLGLSLFQPDFLICSFYKVFGDNPSGLGCLFVKKSSASVLMDSTVATSVGLVTLLPVSKPSQYPEESVSSDIKTTEKSELDKDTMFQPEVPENEERNAKKTGLASSEIEELEDTPLESVCSKTIETTIGDTEIECRGMDHADSLGLILISSRTRCLINWLINALMNLQHPNSENGPTPVRIYGPKVKFDRGPSLAFNIYDWKGEKIDPALLQKLADRNNISLSCGFLCHIWFSDKYLEEKEQILETKTAESAVAVLNKKRNKSYSGISVVTAAVGLLTNFEDTYRLWQFVSRFLDADFVEKERWRYMALNQKTIEV
ncbi:Pyridoxal phosphate-dependent transferases superfamily protein [Tripterygium wilfordii]|uniref:Pyridoxal phosphate-dependent transferases superfamily protein n=1 Tax=Tripterygium wilfordii TaxID=458696 RepID=A0A7J7C730_TRIWF|nr:molybdenum cofactor sulfurase-like [Tripterygium wilfordii]KAF5729939.1 Pyridoxal phosphate-dependent transferases superfamily protein [Tripterygium wilfordii]